MKPASNSQRLSAMAEARALAQVQAELQSLGLERLDAQLLMLHVLGRQPEQRSWLLAHDTDPITEAAHQQLRALAQQRLAGQPLAYLTGRQAFYGLDLHVGPGVLVPRPDTETLVDWALDVLPKASADVLDLGTGSGAIALAIKSRRPQDRIWAVERSPDALAYARNNAHALGLTLTFAQGNWYQALPSDAPAFDCIVCNPPYIAEGDRHLAALHAEPLQALRSGRDGLDDVRAIVLQASTHLRPDGWLLIEHGHDQAGAVRALLRQAGFVQEQSRMDLQRNERCSGARRI